MTAGTASVTDTFTTLTPIPAPVHFSKPQGPSGSTPSVSDGILPPISHFLQSLPELNLHDTKVSLGDASVSSATLGYSYSSNDSQRLPSPPLGVGSGAMSEATFGTLLSPKSDPTFTTAGPIPDLSSLMGPSSCTAADSSTTTTASGMTTAAGYTQQIPGVAIAASFCNPTTGFSTMVPAPALPITAPQVTSSGVPGASTSTGSAHSPGDRSGIHLNRLGVLADVALLYGGP